MTMAATSVASALPPLYFGKLPSRGDFVRSAGQASLIASIDRWQSQVMDRLAVGPRWKLIYDAAPALPFAIVGTGSKVGLAGYWMASQDASGRRFPFITASAFDLPRPRDAAHLAPLVLGRTWTRLEQVARVAHAAADLAHAHGSLNAPMDVLMQESAAQACLAGFAETHTVASLEQMLAACGNRLDVRQSTLALGLLLQPAMVHGASRLNKLLCLPLVKDPAMRPVIAAWWLSLVLGFFQRHAVEFALFMTPVENRPHLLLGFQGASAAAFHAVIERDLLAEQGVFLHASEWVEEEVGRDHGLRKLSNYMRDPGLSLMQVLHTYREVFLGV
ncbi:MAG: type VI secretion system-associated protein TagF [Aquabacterium sp.]